MTFMAAFYKKLFFFNDRIEVLSGDSFCDSLCVHR